MIRVCYAVCRHGKCQEMSWFWHSLGVSRQFLCRLSLDLEGYCFDVGLVLNVSILCLETVRCSQSVRHICSGTARQLHCFGIRAGSTEPCWRFVSSLSPETCRMQPTILVFVTSLLLSRISFILSASLYVSKRGAYWDRLYRDVVGRWLVGCHARALWPNGAS